MQASTIDRTAITSVHVIPLAMNSAFSRIHSVSKSAAANRTTSSVRIVIQTAASFSLKGTRAEKSSKRSRRLRLMDGGARGRCRLPTAPLVARRHE